MLKALYGDYMLMELSVNNGKVFMIFMDNGIENSYKSETKENFFTSNLYKCKNNIIFSNK